MNKILEIGSRKSRGGKRRIEIVLHKIPTDPKETNRNGLHWSEENTLRNIETVKGIPICAEFMTDEKDIPVGHGFTGMVDIDGLPSPAYENSEVCGSIDHGEIRDIEVNGEKIRALVGVGVLYEHRYPKFVQWVRDNVENSTIDTSIEIVGYEENDNKIIYEAGECSEKFRCPKEYQYSGTAILSVLPADSDAIVLECAEAKIKEETAMTEQEIMEVVKNTISECNDTAAAHSAEVAELNETISQKDSKITELEEKVSALEADIAAKDTTIAELNTKVEEQNTAIEENKKAQKISELNDTLASFSEEEQKYAEAEINAYKENPLEGDVNAIKAKISIAIVEKQKADEKVAEQNSANEEKVDDIFGEVDSVSNDDEDVNIF